MQTKALATEAVAGADINVADAWKLTGGNNQVIVAIVDEGVKYTHPDLAAQHVDQPRAQRGVRLSGHPRLQLCR